MASEMETKVNAELDRIKAIKALTFPKLIEHTDETVQRELRKVQSLEFRNRHMGNIIETHADEIASMEADDLKEFIRSSFALTGKVWDAKFPNESKTSSTTKAQVQTLSSNLDRLESKFDRFLEAFMNASDS